MRDDLLDPRECVDWAIAQLDVLQQRIAAWIDGHPYGVRPYKNPDTGNEVWQVDEIEPIPRRVNVEAGLIVNSLRSSLDMLANKLAERNGHLGAKDVYFPVSRSVADFEAKRGGREKIKRLSAADQIAIERLQAYHGGDNAMLLLALHDMDNARKHRRLLEAHSSPHGFSIYKFGLRPEIDALMRQQPPEKGYVEARGATNPDYQVQVRIEVAFSDAGILSSKPVIPALRELADTTGAIIALFDDS